MPEVPRGIRGVLTVKGPALLRRIAAACDPVAPATWVRGGAPLPLLLLALWLVPFMLAGVVRYGTRMKDGPSLVVAIVLVILLGAICWARPKGPRAGVDGTRRLLQIGGVSIGLLIVAWACSLLYSDDMGALAVYYGPDGGTHIAIRRLFVESDPKVYAGFVSLYAVMDLLERILSLVPPGSLVLSFYSAVAAVAVVPVVSMVVLLQGRRGQRGPRLAGLAAFSIAWCWCLKRLALPVLSNIQVDGFYAHFFGFLPLALLWVADVLFRPTLLRLFWVGLGVLLLRFTYGLNLGDVLITCGIVWLFDAVGSRRRVLPLLAGLGALGAGIVAYLNLAPVFLIGGYVEGYPYKDLPRIVRGAVFVLAAYGIIDALVEARPGAGVPLESERETAPRLLAVVRVPLILAGISLIAYHGFTKIHKVETYYLLKYQLMPMVFLAAAASIALGYTAFLVMRGRARPVLALAGVGAIFALGILSMEASDVFKDWQKEMAERDTPPPHPKLRPLIDPVVWKTIQETLRHEGKAFGGFISADFPAGHVLNAWMGFDEMYQVFYPPKTTPGHCVFWNRAGDDVPTLWNPDRGRVEATRAALEADPRKVCDTYAPPWAGARHSICHRCY